MPATNSPPTPEPTCLVPGCQLAGAANQAGFMIIQPAGLGCARCRAADLLPTQELNRLCLAAPCWARQLFVRQLRNMLLLLAFTSLLHPELSLPHHSPCDVAETASGAAGEGLPAPAPQPGGVQGERTCTLLSAAAVLFACCGICCCYWFHLSAAPKIVSATSQPM